MGGLLFCKEEKIRLIFKHTFTALSKNFKKDDSVLAYLLGLLGNNFTMISDKPARQFFDLFNELIDLNAQSNITQRKLYDPELLLS